MHTVVEAIEGPLYLRIYVKLTSFDATPLPIILTPGRTDKIRQKEAYQSCPLYASSNIKAKPTELVRYRWWAVVEYRYAS
jgi:hypothetical protein